MPDKQTIQRARRDARAGKSPGTQAGEFVREEIHHVREGKHGAQSTKQAIAIGLSKARRAGVDLPPPAAAKQSPATRKKAARDLQAGQTEGQSRPSPRRSRAASAALEAEPKQAASHDALSEQAKTAAPDRRIHAPGKQHRMPPPSEHGVQHSNQMIAKARQAAFSPRRGRS